MIWWLIDENLFEWWSEWGFDQSINTFFDQSINPLFYLSVNQPKNKRVEELVEEWTNNDQRMERCMK